MEQAASLLLMSGQASSSPHVPTRIDAKRAMKALSLEAPKHWKPSTFPLLLSRARARPWCAFIVSAFAAPICPATSVKCPSSAIRASPGHELGVEVVTVAADVTNVRPGDRCAVEPYINCQVCYACRRGHTNCCEKHQTLGVHCDGGLRPHFLVPAPNYISRGSSPSSNSLWLRRSPSVAMPSFEQISRRTNHA